MQETQVNMSKLFPMTISSHNRRGGAILATFLAALAFVPNVYAADALDIALFDRKIPITVSGYTGEETLLDFPVLVTLAKNSPAGFSYDDCATDGADLRFADATGALLSHEIETWNPNGTSYIWVRVPSIVGKTTTFSGYYGTNGASSLPAVTATDVWSRYAAVFHGGVSIADATGKAEAITPNGATTAATGGMAGGVMTKGNAKGVAFSNPVKSDALSSIENFSFSGWFRKSGGTTAVIASNKGRGEWNGNGFVALVEGGNYFSVGVGVDGKGGHQPSSNNGKGKLDVGTWGHLAFSYDKSKTALDSYFNGNGIFSTDSARDILDPDKTDWAFGGFFDKSDNCFQGNMDEVRILNGTASADWIKAEYDSINAPTTFAVLDDVVAVDTARPRFSALSEADTNCTATFSVALDRLGFGGAVPTYVSVFYGTDGATWTELPLGSTSAPARLTATASGFAVGVRYLWYAVATATQDGETKTTTSPQQSFVARALEPTGNYKFFTATVVWDGAPAENLPFLLRISESRVIGFDYDDVTASGLEILDADGQPIPFEVDTWNTDGESLVWVLLPVYKNGATVTVRYGAPFANARLPATDVWTSYVAVWHMNEILEDAGTGKHYTPDSSASGWHAYKSDEADTVLSPVTTAPGASAHPTPLTGTAMNIAYGAGKSSSSLGGFIVPAEQTSSTTLNGPGFTLSAIVNSQQVAINSRCRVIAFGNAYNDRANLAVGSNKIYCMGSDSHDKAHSKGATDWVYAVDVFNSPRSKIYADGVCLSGDGGNPNLASIQLEKGIGLGCFTDGKQCLDGYLDEARIRNAASTADWIAAEYHTMADGAVSFSSVSSSDTSAPVLGTPSVARNADGSFTVSVEVSENTPASIICRIGGNDYTMTTADASLPATYSALISDLPNGTHVASVRVTGTSGTLVSATCPDAFHVGALAVAKLSDADEGTASPGVFRVSRLDADSTGLPAVTFDVAFSGSGLAAVADPGISTATIPVGAAYVDITMTPVPTDEVEEDAGLVLTVSGAHVGQSSTASLTVVNATFDIAVRYVAADGNDANSGGTPETPKRTIAAAVAAVDPVAPVRSCTVHVAPGLYPISSPIVVTNAIHVLGGDSDPSRTVVSNTFNVNWDNQNKRVFRINHASALVANLTLQNGQGYFRENGGNLSIGSDGGTVSNCVVEAGVSAGQAQAAGAYLEGGFVTHSIFRKNKSNSGTAHWGGKWKGVLYMTGSASVENCLFADNSHTEPVVLIGLAGSSTMRNCTIVDTGLASTNEYCNVFAVLNIESQNATVQNVVVAGVTNTIDGATCSVIGSTGRFLNCAFDGDATGLPEGTVTGTAAEFFADYANGDYTPKAGGPLVGKGANYEGMASVDLEGRKRLNGKYIDIGCYESQSTPMIILVR